MTIHNEAKKEDIEKIVIMPGDPLRAKYIAEKFLTDAKLVNTIRGMYAYTGMYKDKKITVMAHGMGMPSVSIYVYELFKFYDVDCIIRIGTCGAFDKNLKLRDVILAERSYTESNIAFSFTNKHVQEIESTKEINDLVEETAKEENLPCIKGKVFTTDAFDAYIADIPTLLKRLPKDIAATEMESFIVFYLAKWLNKKATCLLTVTDSIHNSDAIKPEDRETSLDNMIKLALETARKYK